MQKHDLEFSRKHWSYQNSCGRCILRHLVEMDALMQVTEKHCSLTYATDIITILS